MVLTNGSQTCATAGNLTNPVMASIMANSPGVLGAAPGVLGATPAVLGANHGVLGPAHGLMPTTPTMMGTGAGVMGTPTPGVIPNLAPNHMMFPMTRPMLSPG